MPRVKIQLADNIKRTVVIDTDATKGARLGADVYLPAGTVATPAGFRDWLGVAAGSSGGGSGFNFGPGANGSVWRITGGAPQWSAPAALTKTDDTNVTLALGGNSTTALLAATSLTVGWAGQLAVARGGTNIASYTAGDLLYATGATTLAKLPIGTDTYVLTVVAGVPTWAASGASVTPAALTKTDDTNITLTLGGTPATSLLQATSLTLGWSGTLAKSRGGFGADASALAASITELNYTTGVTSAIQTQLDGKQASITAAALTKADDTNVTLTLGGAPTTALLQAASLTLGWTGTLAVPRGGSGAATLTGYLKGNGTSAFTASATIPYSDLTGAPSIPSNIADGTYTPTLTNITNTPGLTSAVCQYLRIGNTVTVSGLVTSTAVAATTTRFGISLPVASNFANRGQCIGYAGNADSLLDANGCVYADTTNDRAELQYLAPAANSFAIAFHFTYLVV
jgi:hypothetical protein